MAKKAEELTALQVKRLSEPGLHRVGGVSGLALYVAPGGSKSWVLRATVGSLRRDIGLGGYPDVQLAQARDRARECRDKIRAGIDPVAERKALKAALVASQASQLTFREAARRCHAAKAPEFKNEKHRKEWFTTLERHVFPSLGNVPVSEITLPHVLNILEPIWHVKTETATRVRQRIEAVLTWSTVSGYRTGENPARWAGNLQVVLPAARKISKVIHHPALPWQAIGEFMTALRAKTGNSVRALEFAILTAARSGEVRGMTWDEIDLKEKLWTVSADRIKAGKLHKVPLSEDAVKLLKAQPRMDDSAYVFPAPRGGMLTDTALLMVVRRMGVDAVPHGFRSTFKDWARNCTAFADEVSELALAHVNSDATRAAYARDELLPQRERMMKEWARFCRTKQQKAEVVPIKKVAALRSRMKG